VTSALLLLAYATAAGTIGTGYLCDARWTRQSPRLAMTAWRALGVSVLLAIGAAALALTVSLPHVRHDLAGLFNLCTETLRVGYASWGGGATAWAGAIGFTALVGRTMWCAGTAVLRDHRRRARQLRSLELVGDRDQLPGALVLEHALPYAFCVGGRRHRVVVTTGLLSALHATELEAVLAHEDAHGRQRHHLTLLWCHILFGVLAPVFPGFRRGVRDVRLYAEMRADDSARRRVGAGALHTALAAIATAAPVPAGTLAAGEVDVAARLDRLAEVQAPLRTPALLAASLAIASLVIMPLALAAAPAFTMMWEGICLIG
jgi:Zn-dependent protease with chaperone function